MQFSRVNLYRIRTTLTILCKFLIINLEIQISKLRNIKRRIKLRQNKIKQLEQKLITVENEKEEYRIKYSTLQAQSDDRAEIFNKFMDAESKIADLEKELKLKTNSQETLNQKEAYCRLRAEIEALQSQIASCQAQKDTLLQKYQFVEQDRNDIKSDNVKMCQIIRELEQKVREYEQEAQDINLTNGSKIKVLQSELNQLQKDNKSLQAKAEEANNDCERLTYEYKNLLREMSNTKFKSKEIQHEKKEDLMVIKEYEIEFKRLNSKLDKYDSDKRQIIEKYILEIDQIKEQYEKIVTIQKENIKIFKQKVEAEFKHYEKRLQKMEQKNKHSF